MSGLRCQAVSAITEVDSAAWDAVVPDGHPMLSHGFLALLERHGGISGENGWQPMHLTLHQGDRLVGALPLYLKAHSWGEFVFDWAWAEAFERAGQPYYPKLLSAIPLSPVMGPRLLDGGDPSIALALARGLRGLVESHHLSSAHVNFVDDAGAEALASAGFLERRDWQYHWRHAGESDFDGFLGRLRHKKRKNIRQERARLARDGWRFERLSGEEATPEQWQAMATLYRHTFERKGNWALLTPEFFEGLGHCLGRRVLLVLGHRGGRVAAGSLMIRSARTLHGRYWGTFEPSPGLHFETCYYQGIEHCIEHGIARFDPGAQGTHKIARGFEPQVTRSFHHIVDPRFRSAVADFLERERCHHAERGRALARHLPFREAGP